MNQILLTGGSSGIGKEVLTRLHNCNIYAPSSSELNLCNIDSINQIDYTKYDTIINCAGINRGTYLGFENNTDQNQLEQIMVNYYGPLMMLKKFLKANTSGTFCYISSYSIIEPYVYNVINASSKSSLQYSIDVLRKEYKNFKFIEIMPSKTKTNMLYTNYQGTKTHEEVNLEYEKHPYLKVSEVADHVIHALTHSIDQVRIKK